MPTLDYADTTQAAVARFIDFYQHLKPDTLGWIEAVYCPTAHFRDPFNDVHGTAAIRRVFEDMFTMVQDDARFVIVEHVAQGQQAFFTWQFHFRLRRWQRSKHFCIEGSSHVRFDEQCCVVYHRDYWDKAQELYEHFPVLGALMRGLRKAGALSNTE